MKVNLQWNETKVTNNKQSKSLIALIGLLFLSCPNLVFAWAFDWDWTPPTAAPSVPSSISAPANVTSQSSGSWTVSWGASTGTVYNYELWESAAGGAYARVYQGTGRSYAVSGKTVSAAYSYKAKACNTTGCSAFTSVKTVNYTQGQPSTLTLPTSNISGTYTVSWPSKSGNGALSVTLQEKIGSGAWVNVHDATNSTSKTFSGKASGSYSYRLSEARRFCWNGCWDYTIDELPKTITVTRPPAAVATPSVVNKTDNTDTTFTINWNAANTATRYELYRRQAAYGGSYGSWSLIQNSSARSVNQTFGNGHYQYRVRACNGGSSANCGSYSSIRTVTVLTLPGATGNPAISNKADNADADFSVSWSAGSGRVTRYELYRRQASYGSSSYGGWSLIHNGVSNSLAQNLGDAHYQYYARACNESGCSSNSSTITTTVLKKPGTPGTPAVSNKTNNADTSFTVSWAAGSGRNERFELYRRQAPYGSSSYGAWSRIHNASGTSIQQTLGNGQYQYYVRSYNASGYSANSGTLSVTVLTASGVPGAITVSGSSDGDRDKDGAYSVNWSAAGGVVDRYELYRRQANYGSSTYGSWSLIYNGSALTLAETGQNDGHYQYQVRACNSSGCSAYTAIKHQDVLHVPATPSSISGPADSDGRFTLNISYGAGYITAYQLQDSVDGGTTWANKESGSGKPTTLALMRPAYDSNGNPQENYRFRIAACNASGCSAYSSASNTVHVNPPGTPASISLSDLSHAAASTDADGNYRLNWSVVSVSGVTYTAEEKVGSGAWQILFQNHTATHFDISSRPEGDYSYRVKACLAGVGCGDMTAPITVKVANKPGTPAAPTFSNSFSANASIDGSFTLNWLKPAGTVTHYFIHKNAVASTEQVITTSRNYSGQPDGNDSYQVQACNHAVCSDVSSSSSIQLLHTPGTPGAIQGPADSDNNGGFTLTWVSSTGTVDRYEILENGGSWQNHGTSLQLVRASQADGAYTYQVRACNSLSCSTATSQKTVTVYNAPGTPGAISGPASSRSGDYTLNWGASSGNVTNYRLEEQIAPGGSWQEIQNSLATTASLTGKANADYLYRVRACNGPNCSNYTTSFQVDVIAAPAFAANSLDTVSAYQLPVGDNGVGATGGNHEVSNDGSANYSIAIPAAGGRGGLTPELALVYNSNGGNTELGVGWEISGLPRIHRCGSNYALDGRVDGINFNNNDQLCLDGQRLVATNGTHGASGTEYRTLRDDFSEVLSMGTEGSLGSSDASSNSEAFRVRTRDGRILYFGGTPDSRLSRVTTTYTCSGQTSSALWGYYCINYNTVATHHTYQWLISRIEDRQGNKIHFSYDNNDSTGEQRLSEVRYNDDLHRIAFNWTNRTDKSQAYFAGSLLTQNKRLASIISYSSTTALRSLHLGYSNSGATGFSKINQITECAGDSDPATAATGDCLQPTVFNWQEGVAGYDYQTSNISNYNYQESRRPWSIDINGDGFEDILSGADNQWKVALGGTNSLTDWHITSTFVTDDDRNYALTLRYNNDVRDDLLIVRSGYWYVLLADPNNNGFLPLQSTGIPSTGYNHQPKIMDMNGDGRGDLVYRAGNGNWTYRLLTNSGFGSANDTGLSTIGNDSRQYSVPMDINGDGLQDLLVPHGSYYKAYLSTGSGFRLEYTTLTSSGYKYQRAADLNGDGLMDILFRVGSQVQYALNKGGQFTTRQTISGLSVTDKQWRIAQVLDYNHDGRSDLWINGQFIHQNPSTQAIVTSAASPYLSGTFTENRHVVVLDYNGDSLDDVVVLAGGAGQTYRYTHRGERPDYLTTVTNGMGAETHFTYRGLHDGSDLLANANSDFYQKQGESQYPLLAESSSAYVISELAQSNGIGGLHRTTYKYRGLRSHMAGLGSLGFAQMITKNNDTGIRTEVSYSHDHTNNQQGAITRVETIAPDDTVLSLTTNAWQTVQMDASASGIQAKRHRIELTNTEITKRDLNGAFLHRETNDYTYDSFGNADILTSKVYDAASGGTLMRTKTTDNNWQNDTANWLIGLLKRAEVTVTDHSQNAPQLKKLSTFDYDTSNGRKVAEQILDPNTNLVLHETRFGEDSSGQLQQDSFGNLEAVTVRGADFASRTTRITYDTTYGLYPEQSYDAQGNLTAHSYYDKNDFSTGAYPGKLKLTTAPNGLQTQYRYDRFGRVTETTSAYGTAAAVTSYSIYRWCHSNCPSNAVYTQTQFTQGGTPVHTDIDMLGRTLRKRTIAMDGRDLWVDTIYDTLGHNTQVTEPYFAGDSPLWNSIQYDILGRAIRTDEPSGRVDTISYNGLSSVAAIDITGANQTKTEVRDNLNNLISVTDNINNTVNYQYDSLGRQLKVIDPNSNTIDITYNDLGQKVAMSDPDKGDWTYTYNGLGQLITQTDAKGQTTCMAYDTLGRMVKRIDNYIGSKATGLGDNAQANQQCAGHTNPDDITQWVYNTSGNGLGQLASVNSLEYSESHGYDSYGRATQATTVIKGESFTINTTYDSLSRPDVLTYPQSNGSHNRLAVRQHYNALGFNTGTYSTDGSVLYSRPEAIDARGNIISTYHGNGIRTDRHYDAATGYLNTINSHHISDLITGNTPVQQYTVNFDLVGNLIHRSNWSTGFDEDYGYDNLNRLTDAWSDYSTGTVQHTEVRYDNLGNITYKSRVGEYSYGTQEAGCARAAGPHAVTAITPLQAGDSKTASYCYDANGNMTKGDGRDLTYTAFDKPDSIIKGANSTQMHYGAGRQLVHRRDITVQNSSTAENETWLLGGVYERVVHHQGSDTGKVEERHYVGGVIVTYSHDKDGNTARNATDERRRFTHTDHLGSIVAITDEIGFLEERLSFDAWGKRRAVEQFTLAQLLQVDPYNFVSDPLGLKSKFTDKGFTGHQQLDGVGIIHMGGRIYDAEIGRFLQADPFVQDRTNLQGLNRYSYVENNPLSYTDPTGYFLKKLIKKSLSLWNKIRKTLFWKPVKKLLRAIGRVKWLSSVVNVVLNIIPGCQVWCSMLFNAAMSAAHGGSFSSILKGAAIGAVVGQLGFEVGGLLNDAANAAMGTLAVVYKSALAGGTMIASGIAAKAQGGKFIDGVKGAAIGLGIASAVNKAAGWISRASKVKEVEWAAEADKEAYREAIACNDPSGGNCGVTFSDESQQFSETSQMSVNKAGHWQYRGNAADIAAGLSGDTSTHQCTSIGVAFCALVGTLAGRGEDPLTTTVDKSVSTTDKLSSSVNVPVPSQVKVATKGLTFTQRFSNNMKLCKKTCGKQNFGELQ